MDLTPGPEIPDEMIDIFEDARTTARVIGCREGLRGWPLVQYEVRAALAKVASLLSESAYRAGREEAARDIEAAAPEPLINISGRSSKPTADEAVWFARLMAYGHAASIAREPLLAADRDPERDSDAVAEAAEIAWRRLYDRWFETHDRSPASVMALARAEFRAGDRHRAAVEAVRAAGRVWMGPDEAPVDQR